MNFQLEQDKIIKELKGTPTLLLHSCCGPCSSYCIEALSKHFLVTVLWYNPNIQPHGEHELRLENQKKLIDNIKTPNPVKLTVLAYDEKAFLEKVMGLEDEPEGGARCRECFNLRIDAAARYAKEKDFDYFTATLTVSPHKNASLINEIGFLMGEKYGVKYLPADFKKRNGYKRSIELSREYDLYRQNYCGCTFSKRQG